MARERLYLFDTTLRDGAQTTGVDFSLEDKLQVAALLDGSASTTSRAAIPAPTRWTRPSSTRKRTKRARFTAFGMTQAGRALRLQRPRRGRRCWKPSATPSASWPRPGTTMSTSRSAARSRRISMASRDSVARGGGPRARGDARLRALLRRLQGQSRLRARLRPGGATRPARAGSCCATPMAARCRTRSRRIVARGGRATCRATHLGIHAHDDTGQRRRQFARGGARPARARSRAR